MVILVFPMQFLEATPLLFGVFFFLAPLVPYPTSSKGKIHDPHPPPPSLLKNPRDQNKAFYS